MMRFMNNKKAVRIISCLIAVIFIAGVAVLAYTQMQTPSGQEEAGDSNFAYVDTQKILTEDNPLVVNATKEMQEYQKQLKSEYDSKAASADDATKQKLQAEMQQKLQAKQMTIMQGIQKQITDAAQAVAKAKGLSVVVDKEVIMYGGTDITQQVQQKLAKDSAMTQTPSNQQDATGK